MLYHLLAAVVCSFALSNPFVADHAGLPEAAPGVGSPTASATAEPAGDARRWPLVDATPIGVDKAELTALGAYVNEDDGAYKWELAKTTQQDGLTIHQIRLTSQRWRTEKEVSHPLWTHWLVIGVPAKIKTRTPIMIIGGGRRREEPRDQAPAELLLLVRSSDSVVCVVDNVPNQPLSFEGEQRERTEDDLLAHSWNLAIRDDDARWIGRFPMVKAAKRAMDAAQEFLSGRDLSPCRLDDQPLTSGFKPDGFFVTGGSKRGWTTWLIAAVDPRVKAIAPLVIDILNMAEQTPHHFASYGFWAPALKDYVDNGIDKKFGSPELARVIAHEDPAAYMKFVEHIPKFIVTATGDEFFPADSARHYVGLLKGEWRLRSVPNSKHNLRGTSALLDTLAFYKAVVAGKPRPTLTWEYSARTDDDTLTVRTGEKPLRVMLWQCDNPKGRDFRVDTVGPSWSSSEVEASPGEAGTFKAQVKRPEAGWRAFMIECAFDSGTPGLPLVFTTQVYVTPDTLPFKLPDAAAAGK